MASTGFYLFLLYNLSYFLHFTSRVAALGSISFDKLLVFSIFGCLFFSQIKKNKIPDDISRRFKIILIYIFISLPFVKWPGSIIHYGFEFYLKGIVFFIFAVAFVDTENKLKTLVWVFLGCQIFRIIEPGYLHVTEGYWGSRAYSMTSGVLSSLNRLSSAPADVLNPTQFAGLIVTILPFLYFLLWKAQKKLLKILVLCLVPICLYVLFLTGARSGLICLLVVLFAIFIFDAGGKIKLKTIIYPMLLIIPLLFISLQLLPPEFRERYISLVDSSTKGHDTAAGRMKGLTSGFGRLFTIRNIIGHGLGTSAEANYHSGGHHIRSHSFYIEAIQEVGIVGMFLFIKYVQSIFKSLALARQKIEERKKTYQWNLNLIKSLQAWAVMYLVYCIICFGFSSWEWYFFGGMAAVSFKFTEQFQNEADDKIKYKNIDYGHRYSCV